jgi:hypothetical protein
MKLWPLICSVWLIASCPLWAADQERLIEFQGPKQSKIYDLATVRTIQPGRFTIVGTSIDNPDVMQLELKVLEALQKYCTYNDGQYPAPTDLLVLGPPDMPVTNIDVKHVKRFNGERYKRAIWFYPYKKLAVGEEPEFGFLECDRPDTEARNLITNGVRTRELFDCKRGLWGKLFNENGDPAEAFTHVVPVDSLAFRYYWTACRAVTHEEPYVPKK